MGTRWSASSTSSAPASPAGRWDSAPASAWHGGQCGFCDNCRRGEFFACLTAVHVTGVTRDGGYADYVVARAEALARVPDDLSAAEAAPLMCAGVTTFNALRNSGARPSRRAVRRQDGLPHRRHRPRQDKAPLAAQLGASRYIDSQAENPAAALSKMGGARLVLATVTAADAMTATVDGLAATGALMVLGAAGPLQVPAMTLLLGRRAIKGWYRAPRSTRRTRSPSAS